MMGPALYKLEINYSMSAASASTAQTLNDRVLKPSLYQSPIEDMLGATDSKPLGQSEVDVPTSTAPTSDMQQGNIHFVIAGILGFFLGMWYTSKLSHPNVSQGNSVEKNYSKALHSDDSSGEENSAESGDLTAKLTASTDGISDISEKAIIAQEYRTNNIRFSPLSNLKALEVIAYLQSQEYRDKVSEDYAEGKVATYELKSAENAVKDKEADSEELYDPNGSTTEETTPEDTDPDTPESEGEGDNTGKAAVSSSTGNDSSD